ncbi:MULTISPECIES: cell division protein FtsZ [Rhodomicrobium]|uniref:cell division protein FtsZ n=1 Tax=Rhodomicrobium TaxID=1068 RepID=UPI000B4B26A2|nr:MULTISPECIES: cell division protein FtsZ [Rhodomicrobium]
MSINLKLPALTELRPRITVVGVGGAGGNAVNNMIQYGLEGVEFIAANTDAQALSMSAAGCRVQMGSTITEGLGAGSKPEIGAAAAEEASDELRSLIEGAHMLFITAGMGGGTGTGAAPVIARAAKEMGILTVGVVTKPFEFEGQRRMRVANEGILQLSEYVDTLIVIPNQNLFRIANEKTTFADAFQKADDVLKSGVSCITDLMVKEGLINLDFADVRVVMQNMGTALMGTGEAEGDQRALRAAEAAISNPLLDEVSMRGAKGLLISITGSFDMTLYEVEEAASRVRREVDPDANPDINIIVGATFDHSIEGRIRVSVVATGINAGQQIQVAQATDALKGARLMERIGTPAARIERDKPLPRNDNPPADTWQGSGNVTIEPRSPKFMVNTPSAARNSRPPQQGQFEPQPPAKPIRPPRRPLTGKDFPELAEHEAEMQGQRDLGLKRRGGLLDWVTGRTRGPDEAMQPERPMPSFDSTGREGSHQGDDSAPRNRDNKNTDRGRNGDEPFEIPNFFKKPLN